MHVRLPFPAFWLGSGTLASTLCYILSIAGLPDKTEEIQKGRLCNSLEKERKPENYHRFPPWSWCKGLRSTMLVLLSQSLLQQGTIWVLGQKTMEKIQMKKKAFSTLSGRCLWFVPFYRQKRGVILQKSHFLYLVCTFWFGTLFESGPGGHQ